MVKTKLSPEQMQQLEKTVGYMLVPQVMLNQPVFDVETHDAYHFKLGEMLISISKETIQKHQ